jgi:hypothetical protein
VRNWNCEMWMGEIVTWAWFGGVDFEEEDDNAEKMSHVAGESEDVHGSVVDQRWTMIF